MCASVRVRVLRRGDPRDRLEDRQLSLSSKRLGLTAAIPIEERAEDSACFRGPPMRGRSATPTAGRRGCAGCQPAARAQSCAGCMDAHVAPEQLRQEPTAVHIQPSHLDGRSMLGDPDFLLSARSTRMRLVL